MDLKNARKHSTDILFVLLLFLVFTSSALAVILLGAKVYQNTASRMESGAVVWFKPKASSCIGGV